VLKTVGGLLKIMHTSAKSTFLLVKHIRSVSFHFMFSFNYLNVGLYYMNGEPAGGHLFGCVSKVIIISNKVMFG